MDIVGDFELEAMTKVKLKLKLPDGQWTDDAYANVTDVAVEGVAAFPDAIPTRLGFTSLADQDRIALEEAVDALTQTPSEPEA